ncbi:hypothetical protein JXB11_04340 [Candidatus Woesearchaeota archaeon]|nr:hypothetical protein [Candidatus Woesearchaeota archaeon]
MAERRLVVDNLKLSYEGIFNVGELYQLIDRWFREKGFDKREVRNQEHVQPEGKYIELELQPWKRITDYARHVIRVDIRMFRVKDVVVEQEGKRHKMQSGKVNIVFDGYLDTDYEDRWEQKPFYFFLRTLFDKFVYRTYSAEFEDLLVENVTQLQQTIKSFLNLYRHSFGVHRKPELWKL